MSGLYIKYFVESGFWKTILFVVLLVLSFIISIFISATIVDRENERKKARAENDTQCNGEDCEQKLDTGQDNENKECVENEESTYEEVEPNATVREEVKPEQIDIVEEENLDFKEDDGILDWTDKNELVGIGLMLTGEISYGSFHVGDFVIVGRRQITKIVRIVQNGTIVDKAIIGDKVKIVLEGLSAKNVRKGMEVRKA